MLHTTRAMLERAAYLGYLGLLTSSLGCISWGVCIELNGDGPSVLLGGFGGVALVSWLGPLGRKYLHFDRCENSFEFVEHPGFLHVDSAHEARAAALRGLLTELDGMEESRQQGRADIWEVHSVRHRAGELLREDPILRKEFDTELQRHPDVG